MFFFEKGPPLGTASRDHQPLARWLGTVLGDGLLMAGCSVLHAAKWEDCGLREKGRLRTLWHSPKGPCEL